MTTERFLIASWQFDRPWLAFATRKPVVTHKFLAGCRAVERTAEGVGQPGDIYIDMLLHYRYIVLVTDLEPADC